jgi:acyl carrier protein
VAIPERTICKTTSGKIQRRATRQKLHNQEFNIVAECGSLGKAFGSQQTFGSTTDCSGDTEGSDTLKNCDEFEDLVSRFFGSNFDPNASWEDLGLTSLASVEFKNAIEHTLPVAFAPDCFETYPTPKELGAYIRSFE